MTSPYTTVPTYMELRDQHNLHMMQIELDFWKAQAGELQNRLEKMFDHANEHGKVILLRANEKIELRKVLQKDPAA
jgi:hypothetical protein